MELEPKADWIPDAADLKQYPHFDKPLSLKKIKALVNDADRVAKNTFYPFIRFDEGWQPFRSKESNKPAPKIREIRYASRRDAYIFAKYRHELSSRYEHKLKELGIESCPVAYRKICKNASGGSGKCNIDFANDAFSEIDKLGDCIAIALDISKFFESLDHQIIHNLWKEILGVSILPPDHAAVFKNITKYAYVMQRDAYVALGYIVEEDLVHRKRDVFKLAFKDIPKQLCSGNDFKSKIVPLIKRNKESYGIPQGAPISDLIANFYLLYFDVSLNEYANARGGKYMRYSDDILIILPGGEAKASEACKFTSELIKKHGDMLVIKEAKTSIVQYVKDGERVKVIHLGGPQGKNGVEYLGFRYDGRYAYIRESTISRLHRKISVSASLEATNLVARYPGKDLKYLFEKFDYTAFAQRFGKVAEFEKSADNVKKWTFWTYVKRSTETLGAKGVRIPSQVKNQRKFMKERVNAAIIRAFTKHLRRKNKAAAIAAPMPILPATQ